MTSLARTSSDPSQSGGVGRGHVVFLAIGLLLFVGLVAVPVTYAFLGEAALRVIVGAAEALEQTQGLVPGTFKLARPIAVIVTIMLLWIELKAVFGKPPEGTTRFGRVVRRPSVFMSLLLLVTIVLVGMDLSGTDVWDLLTTTLVLLCLGYLYAILPVGLLELTWRIARGLWRAGTRSTFGSGALGAVGIAFASCLPSSLCVADDEPYEPDPYMERAEIALVQASEASWKGGLNEGLLRRLKVLAEVLPLEQRQLPAPSWAGEGRKDQFDACIHTLHRPDERGVVPRQETIHYFTERGTDADLAEQIVQETLLEVCLGHAKKPYDNLLTRFRWLTIQRRKNHWRRQKHRRSCELDVRETGYFGRPVSPENRAFLDLNRALCQLDEIDQRILRLWASDYKAAEIGGQLVPPMAAAAVRQRKSRAVKNLRTVLH